MVQKTLESNAICESYGFSKFLKHMKSFHPNLDEQLATSLKAKNKIK
jgi:hypothetical protein